MAKKDCTFREGPGGMECDCEVCRFTHKQLTDAPEVEVADPATVAENVILDGPDDVDLDELDELDDDLDDEEYDDDEDDDEGAEPSVYDRPISPERSVYDRPRVAKSLISPQSGPLPDSGPSVYDLAHRGSQPAVPRTAQVAITARKTLLLIVARTREDLRVCEHEGGVRRLLAICEQLEAYAEQCGRIAESIIAEARQRVEGNR